ncbi:peptidase C39 family protein [Streptomyces aidingensis]|uniref:Peptidase_C39 like family protein n=1 Tax=Streptomyces aidingensis TaxID=910347 RepID=A0A1I1MXG1_9ACTN|nr:peptidase C39 family protein [Streptomyces aidingensis]SFC90049.1 Peptidase_C39 like family protein [Streptomyces aidingensis]
MTHRRALLSAALLSALAAGTGPASATPPAAPLRPRPPARHRDPALPAGGGPVPEYHAWTTAADWDRGTAQGTGTRALPRPGIVIDRPHGVLRHTDPHTGRSAGWEYAVWVSPEHRTAAPADELVPSWNAATPPGTWLRVELRAGYADGGHTPWYTLGDWASGDRDLRRTSVPDQSDGRSTVHTDTVAVAGPAADRVPFRSWRLRLTLFRAPGSTATPVVWRAGALASAVPAREEVPATAPGPAAGTELPVPAYSQNVHTGRYPEYDNGGEAWCSPTSVQMVLEFWGHRPTARELAWVDPSYDDPQVCHAARHTYDHAYGGCGNWPFNTAYAAAAHPGIQAVVTRLPSLAHAERLVRAGIPPITSQSFHEGELPGAGYGTAGHLMAVTGFTREGDVVAHDPAGRDNADVRRVYPRRAFENIWLRTRRRTAAGAPASGTGGICYLLFPLHPSADQSGALAAAGIH